MLLFWPTTNLQEERFPIIEFCCQELFLFCFQETSDIEKEWAKFYAEAELWMSVNTMI